MSGTVLLPVAGCLLLYVGSVVPRARTASYVLKKTAQLAGRLFTMLGVVLIFTTLVPENGGVVILVPLMVIASGLAAYAYVLYRDVIAGTYLESL